jgi:hypothetical protein
MVSVHCYCWHQRAVESNPVLLLYSLDGLGGVIMPAVLIRYMLEFTSRMTEY